MALLAPPRVPQGLPAGRILVEQGFVYPDFWQGYSVVELPVDIQMVDFQLFSRAFQVHQRSARCLSYVIVWGHFALVIDPAATIDVYVHLAHTLRVHLLGSIDTHLHSDHVSGGEELQRNYHIPYFSPATLQRFFDRSKPWPFFSLRLDHNALRVLATPGHTPESVTYNLGNLAFVGDALDEQALGDPSCGGSVRQLATNLWESLHHVSTLPEETLLLPAHLHRVTSVPLTTPVGISVTTLRRWIENLPVSPEIFVAEEVRKCEIAAPLPAKTVA